VINNACVSGMSWLYQLWISSMNTGPLIRQAGTFSLMLSELQMLNLQNALFSTAKVFLFQPLSFSFSTAEFFFF